jgi:electron transport complex protein RnfE
MAMGVFIPLIVVNCIIMGRVEGFASKQPVGDVIPDALGMGLGYTWVLTGIALVRELLGAGTILGLQVLPVSFPPVLFFVLPPGGFFVFALFISLNIFIKSRLKTRADTQAAACAGCAAAAGCAACEITPNAGGKS